MTATLAERLLSEYDPHNPRFKFEISEEEYRALIGTTEAWQETMPPTLPPRRERPQSVRDLLPTAPGTGLVHYVREFSVVDNQGGASAVGEASAKPEADMEFSGEEDRLGKVAVWIAATSEAFDDASGLEEYVQNRLRVIVDVREDTELVNGNGTPGLNGILNDPDVQTQTAAADKPKTITAALRKVEDREARATGVVVNPDDYWDVFDLDPQFWSLLGVPTVRTRGIAAGTAIAGDFASGAVLREKPGATVRTADSHDDFFVHNKVLVVVERREQLLIRAPETFVAATLP